MSLSEAVTMDVLKLNLNYTEDTTNEPSGYIMPLHVQLIWITIFMIIAVVGTVGNLTVIWIVVSNRTMRSVANFFIVNLAFSDALSSILNVPATSYSEIFRYWPFGGFYCKFNEGVASICVCVSVITLAVISIERYNAIITPFKPRMRRPTAIKIIVMIWCISFVVIIPQWHFIEILYTKHNEQEITLCVPVWSEMSYGAQLRSIYSMFFLVFQYFLPLACMSFTYGRVARRLWGAEPIGEKTELHLKQKQAKQKVVKMMIVVVITFALCWLPIHLYFLITSGNMTNSPFVNNFFLALFWLAMSNSMYNPIIYCWMNDKFRTGFKKAFRCCFCNFDESTNDDTETKMSIK